MQAKCNKNFTWKADQHIPIVYLFQLPLLEEVEELF